MGFVGPNGAGKSTTIRLLLGLIGAEAGEIRSMGRPVPEQVAEAKREVAYVADDMRLLCRRHAGLAHALRGFAVPRSG